MGVQLLYYIYMYTNFVKTSHLHSESAICFGTIGGGGGRITDINVLLNITGYRNIQSICRIITNRR